jgi:hypothetical protein
MKKFRCYFIAETGKATDCVKVIARTPEDAADHAMRSFASRPYTSVEVWDGEHRELTTRNIDISNHAADSFQDAGA